MERASEQERQKERKKKERERKTKYNSINIFTVQCTEEVNVGD